MNIYEYETCNNNKNEKSVWNVLIENLIESGNIWYLKPIEDNDVKLPVTLVIDDFAKYMHEKILYNNKINKESLYSTIFGGNFNKIVNCLGAFTTCFIIPKDVDLFDIKSTNQEGQIILGFLIIVDKSIKTNMNMVSIVYHEYYHCMQSVKGGILSSNMVGLYVPGKKDYNYSDVDIEKFTAQKVIINNDEERAADKFSRENVSKKMQLWKLANVYCDMNNVRNVFKRFVLKFAIITSLLSQGRNIF